MLMLSTSLGTINQSGTHWLDPNLIIGVVLTAAVLGMRKGLLPLAIAGFDRLLQARPARRRLAAMADAAAEKP